VRPVLRFEPSAPSVPEPGSTDRIAVLDTTWTPTDEERADGRRISVREVAAPILASIDLLTDATERLDAWVAATTVVDDMAIDGTSLWFYIRLHDHGWLQQRILWTLIVDALVRDMGPSRIEIDAGADAGLREVAPLVAERDAIPWSVVSSPSGAGAGGSVPSAGSVVRPGAAWTSTPPRPTPARPPAQGPLRAIASRVVRRLRAVMGRPSDADRRMIERRARRRIVDDRLERLAAEPRPRLLVVLEHARQRIDTVEGPREINPYLGPIVDVLRGGPLDPIELDLKAKIDDDAVWSRLIDPDGERLLPATAIWQAGGDPDDPTDPNAADGADAEDAAAADRIAAADAPMPVAGVDLGPLLARHVAEQARTLLPRKRRAVARIRALLRRLRPAGILLADEYHRQDWLIAAAAEGVPVAAVQHGILHRAHNGYIHASRPAALRLPDRTYVFGRWERALLLERSVFRPEEVVVGGSPRLDLVRPGPVDRAAVRAELSVGPGDRLVVVSGTHGALIRRFHLPMALVALVDRPLPNVHIVVKQHPGEPDDGPYRAAIDGAARARGLTPPPLSIVRSVDLYRLLAAADAHIGIHSTVLSEAVMTRTPNLLFASFASADPLDYLDAGVAVPFRSGADLLALLDGGDSRAPDEATRRTFLDAHYEPGSASRRIAEDLTRWLT
jgi:hypothetical protein